MAIVLWKQTQATSRDDKVPCWIEQDLFLGSMEAAINKDALKSSNVTHILTVANSLAPAHPNDFVYKIIEVADKKHTNLSQYFDECINFIDEAKRHGSGVLVHCVKGRSRSVTIVVAYLMRRCGMRLSQAMEHVKSRRPQAAPNSGFILQLQDFEKSLEDPKNRLFSKNREKDGESNEDLEPSKKKNKVTKGKLSEFLANNEEEIVPMDKPVYSSLHSRSASQLARSTSRLVLSSSVIVLESSTSLAAIDKTLAKVEADLSLGKLTPNPSIKLMPVGSSSSRVGVDVQPNAKYVTSMDAPFDDFFEDMEEFFKNLGDAYFSPLSPRLPAFSRDLAIPSRQDPTEQEIQEAVSIILSIMPHLEQGTLEDETIHIVESAIKVIISLYPQPGLSSEGVSMLRKIGKWIRELPTQFASYRAVKDMYSSNQALIMSCQEKIGTVRHWLEFKKKETIELNAELSAADDEVKTPQALLHQAEEKKAFVGQKIASLRNEIEVELSACKLAKEVFDREMQLSKKLQNAKEQVDKKERELMRSIGVGKAMVEKELAYLVFYM